MCPVRCVTYVSGRSKAKVTYHPVDPQYRRTSARQATGTRRLPRHSFSEGGHVSLPLIREVRDLVQCVQGAANRAPFCHRSRAPLYRILCAGSRPRESPRSLAVANRMDINGTIRSRPPRAVVRGRSGGCGSGEPPRTGLDPLSLARTGVHKTR
jgi:hypothetical protein